jgi:hypothetical protein
MKSFSSKIYRLAAAGFFTCQVFTLQAFSQWSANPEENNAICVDTNQQNACRIASDGSGGAVIAWDDYRNNLPGKPV